MGGHQPSTPIDKIWLAGYPAGVPAEIDSDKYSSLVNVFDDSVARYGERPAFVNFGASYRKPATCCRSAKDYG
jgi:hypothetical protein